MIEICAPSNDETFGSLYEIATNQRAAFYIWLIQNKLDVMLVMSDDTAKCDELGLVTGFKWSDYNEWFNKWDKKLMYPSFHHTELDKYLTITQCDKIIWTDSDELNPHADMEVLSIRHELVNLMLYPYRHDIVAFEGDDKLYSWYSLEKSLLKLTLLLQKNPHLIHLFNKIQDITIDVSNALLEEHYRYKKEQT